MKQTNNINNQIKAKFLIGCLCSDNIKAAVCDSGESLLIFELNSQTNTPLPFSARVTHSISLSCARAQVVTYYTEVFSGLVALPGQTVSSAHTQNRKLADREERFSEFDKKSFGLKS